MFVAHCSYCGTTSAILKSDFIKEKDEMIDARCPFCDSLVVYRDEPIHKPECVGKRRKLKLLEDFFNV